MALVLGMRLAMSSVLAAVMIDLSASLGSDSVPAEACTKESCPETDDVSWLQHGTKARSHVLDSSGQGWETAESEAASSDVFAEVSDAYVADQESEASTDDGQDPVVTALRKPSPPAKPSPPPLPSPPANYYPHFDTTPDYLNIAARASGVRGKSGRLSDNYYIVIGDWGGCSTGDAGICARQKAVATLADQYIKQRKQKNPRSTLLFVLAAGDNFYWTGANDQAFNTSWANVYSPALLAVPWFAVMGNHDYANTDPTSACPAVSPRFICKAGDSSDACGGLQPYSTSLQGYDSNQLNSNKGGSGGKLRSNFHMPDYTFYYSIPDLDFELLALDQTVDWMNSLGGNGFSCSSCGASQVLAHCGSPKNLQASLASIKSASVKILQQRAAAAAASNVAILSHYPNNGFRASFLNQVPPAKLSKMAALNFFGHDHSQKCYGSDATGRCVELLTGGGGGCCGNADLPAGFTAVSWVDNNASQFTECFGLTSALPGLQCSLASYTAAAVVTA